MSDMVHSASQNTHREADPAVVARSLDDGSVRALRILGQGPAYELDRRPLSSLSLLKRKGLIEAAGRHMTDRHGPSTTWTLSRAGRSVLSALDAQ